MQNFILPYSKELERFENRLENKSQNKGYTNSLRGKQINKLDQLERTKHNIFRLETIHQNRKKLNSDYNKKLQILNEKLSHSIEASQQKKDEKLLVLKNKLKKLNQPKKHRQMSFQEEVSERQVESPSKQEISQSQQNQSVQKHEIRLNESEKIKLAEPKQLNQDELFDQLNKSMDAAKQRKFQRLDFIRQKLHVQDEIVHQHFEKSLKNKEELEQQRLNQIYQKLISQSKRAQEKQEKQQKSQMKEKKKSLQLELQKSESQNAHQTFRYQEQNTESIITAKSINNDYKFIQVRQRLEKLNNEREIQAQSILDKHQQYSIRIQQNKQLLDELANTCQYYNFKIKEQYLL